MRGRLRFIDSTAVVAALGVVTAAFGGLGATDPAAGILVTALAAWAAVAVAVSRRAVWPPLLTLLLTWPLVQTLTLPARLAAPPGPVLADLARIGVTPRLSLSIDAATTLQAFTLMAGAAVVFVLARAGAERPTAVAAALGVLAAAGVFQAVLGSQQYFLGLVDESVEAAARGSFVSRGHFAAFLEGAAGAAFGLAAAGCASRSRHAPAAELVAGALAAGCVAGGILSLSRAGFLVLLGEVILAAWLFAPRLRRAALGLVVIALLAGLASAPEAARRLEARFIELHQGRDQGRFAIWRDTLGSVAAHPTTGVGLGAYPYAFRRSAPYLVRKSVENAHNDYLELAAELGLPAALLLFGGIAAVYVRAWRSRPRLEPTSRALAAGCLLGAGAILAHAAVDFPLRLPATAMLCACLLGFASGIARPPSPGGRGRYGGVAAAAACALVVGFQPRILTPLPQRFELAEAAFASGSPRAGAELRELLRWNPYVAPAWLRLASLARSEGDARSALQRTRAAHRVEPHTLRTAWPLAEAELLFGDRSRGLERLSSIVSAAPDLRPAAYRLAWRSGASAANIERRLAAREPYAAGEYLAFLTRTGQWERIPGAYQRLGATLESPHRAFLRRELRAADRRRELSRLEQLGFQ